jgi:phosphatidylglycerol lysyltransferase
VLAEAHGWNATAFQTLGAGFSYALHGDGYVAYADTGSAWVVAGAPVCSRAALARAVHGFVEAAAAAGRRCCFFGVEPRLLAATDSVLDSIQIGEQPVWDPGQWSGELERHASLRAQLRRARGKRVVVTETTPADPAASTLDLELGELLRRFRATRSMPLMGFLVTLPSAWHADGARLFVARRDGHLVGIARLLPVPLRGGWFVEHVLRDPRAPNGTVELLIDGIMRWAAATGCSWLTLGLAPLGGDVPTPLRIARRRLRWLYDFEGLARFKSKLRPSGWTPIYLAFPRSQGTTISVIDALAVFAPGGFLAFGLRFLRRGPPIVLGVLAASLAPWTALLVAAPSDHWFQGHTGIFRETPCS